jgi:hypothetical protein
MPFVPSLPRRSPAEGMIAQAVVGIPGVTLGQYGSLAVDPSRLDPLSAVVTDLDHDAFGTFSAFLATAGCREVPVKWQFVGPVTLGLALVRAGAPPHLAFDIAVRSVRSHVEVLHRKVAQAFPTCPQVVFLDEPSIGPVLAGQGPIDPEVAVDLLSGALAVVDRVATTGVHCCGTPDWPRIMDAGPDVLSLPVSEHVLAFAGYLTRHLEAGGLVAWGAVPTDGPVPTTADRPWRILARTWCRLVELGCDPIRLRRQCIVTPECGLAMHDLATAERVLAVAGDIASRVHSQALATRLTVGA